MTCCFEQSATYRLIPQNGRKKRPILLRLICLELPESFNHLAYPFQKLKP